MLGHPVLTTDPPLLLGHPGLMKDQPPVLGHPRLATHCLTTGPHPQAQPRPLPAVPVTAARTHATGDIARIPGAEPTRALWRPRGGDGLGGG